MKKNERLLAEKFLLQCISDEEKDFVERTMEKFGVSKSTVYNYLTTLQKGGEVERVGGSMPYRIVYKTSRFTVDPLRERSEDRLFSRDVAPLLAELPQNLQKIWLKPAMKSQRNTVFLLSTNVSLSHQLR